MYKQIVIYIVFITVTVWFAGWILFPTGTRLTHGFGAYYTAAHLLKTGKISEAIYNPDYFRPLVETGSHQQASDIYSANPPTTSLMLWPLSFLSIETARFVWILANAAMLWGGTILLILVFADSPTPATFAILLILAMLFQPAIENINFGQAYLLVFLLFAVTVAAWQKHSDKLGGLALASALILKTAGLMLIPLLAWQRRWKFLVWTLGISGIILVITLPLFSISMWQHYFSLFQQVTSAPTTCATAYQTTRSLLCQLFIFNDTWSPTPVVHLPWLARTLFAGLALSTLVISFIINKYNQAAALMSIIAWSIIFAPLGEQYHHSAMLIPVIWLVINWQQCRLTHRFGQICLAAAIFLYVFPTEIRHSQFSDGWWVVLTYPRLYAAWLTLLAIIIGTMKGRPIY